MLVRFEQRADLQGRMLTEVRHQFARFLRVSQASISLAAQPLRNRDTIVAEDHQRVMRIAHDSRQLGFQNLIQHCHYLCLIELFLGHRYLLIFLGESLSLIVLTLR